MSKFSGESHSFNQVKLQGDTHVIFSLRDDQTVGQGNSVKAQRCHKAEHSPSFSAGPAREAGKELTQEGQEADQLYAIAAAAIKRLCLRG